MKKYILPDLPYDYAALEPYFDEETMRLHHDKHHATYVANLNAAAENFPEFFASFGDDFSVAHIEKILANTDKIPAEIRQTVINNGGGHANHSFFWEVLAPADGDEIPRLSGDLARAIDEKFGSFAEFQEKFAAVAKSRFGSGWAWLSVDENGELEISSTANQDTPRSEQKTPILALDVWEHAYYLKYRNVRPDYIAAFWHLVNWGKVAENFANARQK